MADLIINANGLAGGVEFEVGYRLAGSGNAFTYIFPNPITLPVVVPNLPNAQYEVSIKKKCANGVWSVVKNAVSAPCPPPISFYAIRNGQNFDIGWTLAFGQTIFDLELTSPNSSVQVIRKYEGNTGTLSVPITPFMEGEWRLRIRGVCDDSAPNLISEWTNFVDIEVVNPVPCPQVTNGVISNVTDQGFTVTADPPVNNANVVAYTLSYTPTAGGSTINNTAATPNWIIGGLQGGTSYDVYITTNCQNGGISVSYYVGQVTTINSPSLNEISNTDTGVGGTRTQGFQVGASVMAGNKFRLIVYSHIVEVIAVGGDTPTSIATKLKDAVNNTTNGQWNSAGSAPPIGTNGFKPTAISSGDTVTVTLNYQNQFAGIAYYS